MKQFSDLAEEELQKIAEQIPVQIFKKGKILLHQGDIPTRCYFVLHGCVRQYKVDSEGREATVNFYTEHQSITIFNQHDQDKHSKYSLSCVENSCLVVGDLSTEQDMYNAHPFLIELTRRMMEENIGAMHDDFADFITSGPEERYLSLIDKRPGLLERVPQHQLASYLGVTPESLSRIKRRIARDNLKIVD